MATPRPLGVLILLVSVSAGATGCSFSMQTAPSDPARRTRQAARSCTWDVSYPVVDTISTAVGVYNIGISRAARDRVSIYTVETSKKAGLALGITQAAVFGVGAIYGYVQAARCSELRRETRLDARPGDWAFTRRVRAKRSAGDSSTPGESTARAGSAPGSEDDRPHGPAPGSEDDRPHGPAPGTEDAGSTGLPSWSAFRRYPLAPENPPRTPATGSE